MSKVYAHRGFSSEYPENTILAFRKAIEAGCDGIELDVHPTRDGVLVIIHDENIRRTTDGEGLIRDFSLEELRRFNAGAVCDGKYGFQPIPTLREYFDLVKDTKIITNIELKNGIFWYEGMEKMVINLVREYELSDRIVFSSFNHYSIRECLRLAPDIPCGLLTGDWIIDVGSYAKRLGATYVHPQYLSLTDEALTEIKANGIGINTWTVNDAQDMRRLVQQGVDGIISNDPALLRETVDSLK